MIIADSKRNLSAAGSQLSAANVVYSPAQSIAEASDLPEAFLTICADYNWLSDSISVRSFSSAGRLKISLFKNSGKKYTSFNLSNSSHSN